MERQSLVFNEGDIKMESTETEEKCKRCGCKLYFGDSKKAGYCVTCASQDKTAREAWKDKGLAKFCSCGQMLHCDESIMAGMCNICRIKKSL